MSGPSKPSSGSSDTTVPFDLSAAQFAAFGSLNFSNLTLPLDYKKPKNAENVTGYYPSSPLSPSPSSASSASSASSSTNSSSGAATGSSSAIATGSAFIAAPFQPHHRSRNPTSLANRIHAEAIVATNTLTKESVSSGDISNDFAQLFAASVQKNTKPLPFDGSRIAASPRTLRLARLWPKDATKQQLLTTIIEISKSEQGQCILTTPAALALGRCSMRLAGHLLTCAVEQNAGINVPNTFATLFAGIRERTLQQLKEGGWSAATPLPRSVTEEWWKAAREHWNDTFPVSLENETQQALCAAIVVEFVRLILQRLHQYAVAEHVSLLSVVLLSFMKQISESNSVVELTKQIRCTITPSFDTSSADLLQFGLTHSSSTDQGSTGDSEFRASSFGFSSGTESFAPSQINVATFTSISTDDLVAAENQAARFILDEDQWYHNPQLLNQVAQQIMSGERQIHESDLLLRQLKCRVLMWQAVVLSSQHLLPQSRIGFVGERSEKMTIKRTHLVLTDATGEEYESILELSEHNKLSLHTSGDFSSCLVMSEESHMGKRLVGQLGKKPSSFQVALTPDQQQAIEQLCQACELIGDVCKAPSADPTMPLYGLQVNHLTYFGVKEKTEQFVAEMKKIFHNHALETLTMKLLPFLDHAKWGGSRYVGFQSDEIKRKFQSILFDGAMEAIGTQPLPTVLMDLVADFYTIEALPYVSSEELMI